MYHRALLMQQLCGCTNRKSLLSYSKDFRVVSLLLFLLYHYHKAHSAVRLDQRTLTKTAIGGTMRKRSHAQHGLYRRISIPQAKRDSAISLALLIIPNLAAWLLVYPGYLQPDHMGRIAEFAAGTPSSMHSLLWTCVAFPFIYLSPSYAIYGLLQITIFVYCAYRTISILQSLSFIKTKTISALLFGLFPTFLLYNELYCSDIIFSYCIMLLTALLAKFALQQAPMDRSNEGRGGGWLKIELCVILTLAILLRKNAAIIPIGIVIASLLLYRNHLKQAVLIAVSSILIAVAFSSSLAWITNASDSPNRELFAVPSFQIAAAYYHDGSISDESRRSIESQKNSEEWAQAYASGIAAAHAAADYAKADIDVTPKLVNAWIDVGIQNPKVYLEAWATLEHPFWVACTDNHMMSVEFAENELLVNVVENILANSEQQSDQDAYLQLLNEEKTRTWQLPSTIYEKAANMRLPLVTDLFVLILFNRALPFYILITCAIASLIKRNSLIAFIAIPVFCVWLSLILFAPIALMRYAMEMYYAVPVLLTVCIRCKNNSKQRVRAATKCDTLEEH